MAEMVIVPELVGQHVRIARDVAATFGLDLSSGDPDGPGIGSRAWPGLFWVTRQEPSAGSAVARGSQIRIEFVQDGQPREGVRVAPGS